MYDLKISGGLLVDGTGEPPRQADVGVVGDKIVAVAPELPGDAARTIDASGQIVTPGFVDVHPTTTARSRGTVCSSPARDTA